MIILCQKQTQLINIVYDNDDNVMISIKTTLQCTTET